VVGITVARLHFAVAREERDGVEFLVGHVDRLTDWRLATGDWRLATGDWRER
jgi:hypothetical protein